MINNNILKAVFTFFITVTVISCNSLKTTQKANEKVLPETSKIKTLETPEELQKIIGAKGTLIFEDNFNRTETDDTKEQLGKAWVTNSSNRAQGRKQADLDGDILKIVRLEGSNHQTSVRHDAPFDDAIIEVRFKIFGPKGIAFNYNDPKAKKIAHAGHICQVNVRPDEVIIKDQLMGQFNNEILKKRKDPNYPKAQKKELLKDKQMVVKKTTSINEWHVMHIHIYGDIFDAWIDGEKIASFKSEGIDHPVKQNMAFSVPLKADVDDLKIWSLN